MCAQYLFKMAILSTVSNVSEKLFRRYARYQYYLKVYYRNKIVTKTVMIRLFGKESKRKSN